MIWPYLPLQSHLLHLSHPYLSSSTLAGLHFPKHPMLFLCFYDFSCSINTSVPQGFFPYPLLYSINTSVPLGFFPYPLLYWCYALFFYVLIYTQSFNKIPELLSLALNCLLGGMPQSITAWYVGTFGHFTYTSNLTGLKLNSLFSYICSFSFVPYLIQGVIFPAVIQYGNMSPFRFFLISSQYQIFIKSHRVYSQRHSLLSHPITTILF